MTQAVAALSAAEAIASERELLAARSARCAPLPASSLGTLCGAFCGVALDLGRIARLVPRLALALVRASAPSGCSCVVRESGRWQSAAIGRPQWRRSPA